MPPVTNRIAWECSLSDEYWVYTGFTPKSATQPDRQFQNLAFSNDRGRTWTKYAKNPVLNLNLTDFRDPNVFWSAASKRWIMVVSLPNDHKAPFYASPDLKRWDRVSEFGPAGATGGQWECPDLFEARVDGDAAKTRWVLKIGLNPGSVSGGSGEQYFVGQFDGTRFLNENPPNVTLWSDYGKDCYCALTFNNLPASRSPVMLGWMSNWQYADKLPTQPWRGQMTVPREVSLKTFPEGIRMVQHPVAALDLPLEQHTVALSGSSFLVKASLDPGGATQAGWKLTSKNGAYTVIGYDAVRRELFVDRTHSGNVAFSQDFPARTVAPLELKGPLSLDILVDRSSLEVFAARGGIAFTNPIFARDFDKPVFSPKVRSPRSF